MSTEEIDYSFIMDLVEGGELDNMLDGLAETVAARRMFLRDVRGAVNKATFVHGTRVRLINIRPKYLHGITGVVNTNVTPSRHGDIVVDVDPHCWNRLGYRYGKQLNVPASSMERV